MAFFVQQDDLAGGTGANFVVDWVSEHRVNEPVAEAVMIGWTGAFGLSFVSPGRVMRQVSVP